MRDEVCSTQSDQCTTLLHIPQHSTKTMPQLHPRLCKDAASLFQHGCKPNSTLKADARKHALLCSSNSLHKKPPARVWHAGLLSRLGLSTRGITHAQERQRTHTHGNTPRATPTVLHMAAITTWVPSQPSSAVQTCGQAGTAKHTTAQLWVIHTRGQPKYDINAGYARPCCHDSGSGAVCALTRNASRFKCAGNLVGTELPATRSC